MHDGNFAAGTGDGAGGADAFCSAAAAAANLTGRWTAWISTPASLAISRITGNGAWYLMNGTLVFPNKASFMGSPLSPINVDEYGASVWSSVVWTGTSYGGGLADFHCLGFTVNDRVANRSQHGVTYIVWPLGIGAEWTAHERAACGGEMSLYCIEGE